MIRATVQEGNNVSVEEYEYDVFGNRTAKLTEEGKTYYLNDIGGSLTQVLAETDENGNLKCLYTRGEELISQEREGIVSVYLTDGHGSVRQLTDIEGNVTDTYVYDAWGNMISTEGETENSYLYCGEQFDNATGLYYLRARYMNPQTGTFTSMDTYHGSIFDPVSLHKYLYANADPVMNVDPSGYMTSSDFAISSVMSDAAEGVSDISTLLAINTLKALRITLFTTLFAAPLVMLFGDTICEMITDGALDSIDVNDAVIEETRYKKDNDDLGWIIYGELDELGRATGAIAKLTRFMPMAGTIANKNIRPSGFIDGNYLSHGGAGHARSHLIAQQLGGDGADPRNLVTLYQNPTNNSSMKIYENKVKRRVNMGEVVYYSVIPLYFNNELIPYSIHMIAYGNKGFHMNANIINNLKGSITDYYDERYYK